VNDQPVRLSELTTFRLGGPARRFVEATTEAELIETVNSADAAGEPLLVIGGGSNLLVADEGFDGTVVRVSTRGITSDADSCGGGWVEVAAGEPWDAVVEAAIAEEWSGIEALSGIPGSTGATPLQNVGAYGQEVAETIARVRVLDRSDATVHTFAAADCAFGYRTSRFRHDPCFVVLGVTFQLRLGAMSAPVRYAELARLLGVAEGTRAPASDVRTAVLELRRRKGMVLDPADHDTWSAGSFFLNPLLTPAEAATLPPDAPRYAQPDGRVKTPAAWLVQRAGFPPGFGDGPARISTKHSLALTNRGAASTADVLALARTIRDGVLATFGVRLEPEPHLVHCRL
jgi:UDP-N-acetylmuramate dehydrogenase